MMFNGFRSIEFRPAPCGQSGSTSCRRSGAKVLRGSKGNPENTVHAFPGRPEPINLPSDTVKPSLYVYSYLFQTHERPIVRVRPEYCVVSPKRVWPRRPLRPSPPPHHGFASSHGVRHAAKGKPTSCDAGSGPQERHGPQPGPGPAEILGGPPRFHAAPYRGRASNDACGSPPEGAQHPAGLGAVPVSGEASERGTFPLRTPVYHRSGLIPQLSFLIIYCPDSCLYL